MTLVQELAILLKNDFIIYNFQKMTPTEFNWSYIFHICQARIGYVVSKRFSDSLLLIWALLSTTEQIVKWTTEHCTLYHRYTDTLTVPSHISSFCNSCRPARIGFVVSKRFSKSLLLRWALLGKPSKNKAD